ncbi:hypothetical protein OROMI_000803 [Orobanche minor]
MKKKKSSARRGIPHGLKRNSAQLKKKVSFSSPFLQGRPKHWLQHCPSKIKCIKCKDGWRIKCMIEAYTANKWKYFYNCLNKQCNYFEWVDEAKEGDKSYHYKRDSSNTKFSRSDVRSEENIDELVSILGKVANSRKTKRLMYPSIGTKYPSGRSN